MVNRLVPVLLIALLAVVHGQLWFGRGSLPNVAKLSAQLEEQKKKNVLAAQDSARLSAEIHDLKEGLEIVEEKARSELAMVKTNELFIQIAR
ncbi:septum formation initiator family protein [Rhodoferax aquaticus]|uniref:Cell division protein FtsB n=1 Tax=Rhodoferax aquaticus TaxID=2527691 RepID=A0A515EMM7_9BURK|nr:septum formation initiator family protein [Rhodoferax aquaticus]QDL53903.1 septation ring formation regulator EzrA [Rhodoferax aquaticus]